MSVSRPDADVISHQRGRPVLGVPPGRRWLLPLVVLSVVVVGVAAAVGWYTVLGGRSLTCTGPTTSITAAVAPGPAATLRDLARRWTDSHPTDHGHCLAVTVSAEQPAQVAGALGAGWNAGRDGARPDVWVPDSSLWLDVARGRPDAAAMLTGAPPSVATSPVVLAVRQPVAEALGWPGKPLTWSGVFNAFASPDTWTRIGHPEWAGLRVGLTDPAVSTAGLAAVLALLDQNGTGVVTDQQFLASVGVTESIGTVAADTATFFDQQSIAGGEALDSAVAAFPALESEVAAHDAASPATALVPVYLPSIPVVADFPYTVLRAPWVGAAQRTAADRFRTYLRTPQAQRALRAAMLRTPGQSAAGITLPAGNGFAPVVAPARRDPGPAVLGQVVAQWSRLQRPADALVVLDTSGSMSTPVPGTTMTRLQLLQQTATAGFGFLTSRTSMGLWEFSVRPGDPSEYRSLVPYGPLSQPVGALPRQRALAAAAAGLHASGSTPLYDTIDAAVQAMRNRWQPDASTAVVVITDGANEYEGGLSLPALLDKLGHAAKPDRPVPVINIAVGPEADTSALEQISQATGGRTFVAKNPADAAQTLVLAFAGRLH